MPPDHFNDGIRLHVIIFLSLIPHPNDADSSKMKINRYRCPRARQTGIFLSLWDFQHFN